MALLADPEMAFLLGLITGVLAIGWFTFILITEALESRGRWEWFFRDMELRRRRLRR